jgi:hypothetical protein
MKEIMGLTIRELLEYADDIIRRHAIAILKRLQKRDTMTTTSQDT